MNVTPDIPLNLEERYRLEALEQGVSVDEVVSRVLVAQREAAISGRRKQGLSGAEIADLMAASPHRVSTSFPSAAKFNLKLRDIGL